MKIKFWSLFLLLFCLNAGAQSQESEAIEKWSTVALESKVEHTSPTTIGEEELEVRSSSSVIGEELALMVRTLSPKIKVPKPQPKPSVNSADQLPVGGRELSVQAYSYCLQGRTASGRYTKHGIVAVDPRVIPLGSKLHIPGYGWAVAADTGGAIKGNKIDVWLPTNSACFQWGVRQVKIKVFPPQK